MSSNFWKILILIFLILNISAFASRQKKFVVRVNQPDVIWKNIELGEKLKMKLSRLQEFSVILSDDNDSHPAFPQDCYHFDSLLNWGAEMGGQYLLFIDIFSERIERRKTAGLPLIAQRYKTVGIIEGEIRLIDITRNKLIKAEPLVVQNSGPSRLQAWVDDNINDADLNITATKKVAFLDDLENQTADKLVEIVKRATNVRD